MKRTALTLLIGLLAGTAAHFGWHTWRGGASPGNLQEQLEWMKTRLALDAEQYRQFRAAHENLAPRLAELAREIRTMKAQLAQFEQQRVTNEEIDFLQFAQFLQQQENVDREAVASIRELIARSTAAMTPEQRKQYLAMLQPVLEVTVPPPYD